MIRHLFALSLAVVSATTLMAPAVQAGSSSTQAQTTATPTSTPTSAASPAPAATAAPAATPATTSAGTIVDVASQDSSLTTLTKALKAAGLVDVLSGEGPFTVFAPTDEAFAALPKGKLDELLLPANREKLAKILRYHVIQGENPSSSLKAGEVATVEGSSVKISVANGVQVNDAKVVKADIKASNGVIHVIDKVLMPPQK